MYFNKLSPNWQCSLLNLSLLKVLLLIILPCLFLEISPRMYTSSTFIKLLHTNKIPGTGSTELILEADEPCQQKDICNARQCIHTGHPRGASAGCCTRRLSASYCHPWVSQEKNPEQPPLRTYAQGLGCGLCP